MGGGGFETLGAPNIAERDGSPIVGPVPVVDAEKPAGITAGDEPNGAGAVPRKMADTRVAERRPRSEANGASASASAPTS